MSPPAGAAAFSSGSVCTMLATLATSQLRAAASCSASPAIVMPYKKTLTIQQMLAAVWPSHSILIIFFTIAWALLIVAAAVRRACALVCVV